MAKLPPCVKCAMVHPEAVPVRAVPGGSRISSWEEARVSRRRILRIIPEALAPPANRSPSPFGEDLRGWLFVLRERVQFRFFDVEVGVDVRNVFVVF